MKSNRGFPALAGLRPGLPDITARLSRRNGSDRSYQLADTNFTKFTLSDQLFVIIRVIRVFTRLRLNRATAWQAAAFPRRVFGKPDRSAKGPSKGRA
jgi:hypothetical protein